MTQETANEQAIVQQESGPGTVTVTTFYRGTSPQELFRYWIEPELLPLWWPNEGDLDAREGGSYCLSWPSMDWRLRGKYETFEPGSELGFTWKWDHEPATPERHVQVRFEPVGDIGTQLTVTHGTYTTSEADQKEREGHLEGWTYFLKRLHDALE